MIGKVLLSKVVLVGALLVLLFPGLMTWAEEAVAEEAQAQEATREGQEKKDEAEPVNLAPVVVTATRTEQSVEEVASSVSVVTAEDIAATGAVTVKEALRAIPGLDVTTQGGIGEATTVFIRGGRSEDTLVMVDGMEINDPINPGRTYDFADLTTDNVERIEVVRGPQSTLYGSDAIGGVINIITRRGKGRPTCSLLSESGKDNTFREVLSGSGQVGKWDFSFSGARIDSDGIASHNPYEDNTFSLRTGYHLWEGGDLDFVFRSVDAKVDLDDWDFYVYETIPDPNYFQENNNQMYQLRYTQKIIEVWESALKVGYYLNNRDYQDKPDRHEPNFFATGWYDSSLFNVDWQHTLSLSDWDQVVVGVEYEDEKGESYYLERDVPSWGAYEYVSTFSEKSVYTMAYYLQNQLKLWERLFLTAGLRVDDHEEFGTEVTYKTALAYLLQSTGTKFKGTWGTGFKAPTLYQLYAPGIPAYYFLGGNPNLDPEKSESFDVGIEQGFFKDRLRFSAVYFNNEYEDLIEYYSDPVTWTSTYVNLDEAEAEGWELELQANPWDTLFVTASYTYTDTKDKTKGGPLLRRPQDKYSLMLDYDWREKLHGNLAVYYVGKRVDWRTFTGARLQGESYTRVDLALSYTVNPHLQFFSKIVNLFDEEYQELRGYDAAGTAAFGGIKLTY